MIDWLNGVLCHFQQHFSHITATALIIHSFLVFTSTIGRSVVWVFHATLTAKVISLRSVKHVFPGFLTVVLTQLFFPKPPQRLEAKIRRKEVASTGDWTHNNQVMSPTCSPLSHPGGASPVLSWGSEVFCPKDTPTKNQEDPVQFEPRTSRLWAKHFTIEPRRTAI